MKTPILWEGAAKVLDVTDHEYEGRTYSKCLFQLEGHLFRVSLNKAEVISALKDKLGGNANVILEIYPNQALKPCVALKLKV